jgi:hypothetical protein
MQVKKLQDEMERLKTRMSEQEREEHLLKQKLSALEREREKTLMEGRKNDAAHIQKWMVMQEFLRTQTDRILSLQRQSLLQEYAAVDLSKHAKSEMLTRGVKIDDEVAEDIAKHIEALCEMEAGLTALVSEQESRYSSVCHDRDAALGALEHSKAKLLRTHTELRDVMLHVAAFQKELETVSLAIMSSSPASLVSDSGRLGSASKTHPCVMDVGDAASAPVNAGGMFAVLSKIRSICSEMEALQKGRCLSQVICCTDSCFFMIMLHKFMLW